MKTTTTFSKHFSGLKLAYPVLACAFSFFVLRDAKVPYFWLCMAWWPFFLHLASSVRHDSLKIILYNLFLLTLLLGFVELAFVEKPRPAKSRRFESSYKEISVSHPILGYVPNPNNIARHTELYFDGTTMEATYTIDEQGLRATMPPELKDSSYAESLLFFGGSFTFGDAINDTETLPYLVGSKTDWKYKVYNFGFSGYGPHQMLAALENGIVSDIVAEPPKYVVYQAISDHIKRVIHGNPWKQSGPEYKMRQGKPVLVGQFEDHYATNMLTNQLRKSFIYKKLTEYFELRRRAEEAEQLFFEIVKASRDYTARIYPESRFIVVFWEDRPGDKSPFDTESVIEELRRIQIPVYKVGDIIHEEHGRGSKYRVVHNGHPNRLANEAISEYLATSVLR